jgi:Asp-tRNA(Asn)/Glu-tRNA(Gln) amidotransferase B subunit
MHTNEQIERAIEAWSQRVDRLQGELKHAEQQLSAWMSKSPETEQERTSSTSS